MERIYQSFMLDFVVIKNITKVFKYIFYYWLKFTEKSEIIVNFTLIDFIYDFYTVY